MLVVSGCSQQDGTELMLYSRPVTPGPANYRPDEVLVKYRSGVVDSGHMHKQIGAAVARRMGGRIEQIRLPAGMAVEDALQHYRADPDVEFAEPNYIVRKADTIPDDSSFGEQWALRNNGQMVKGVPGRAGADLSMTRAWDLHCGEGSVIVAAIDTGVDYQHPDLAANIWQNPGEIPDNGLDDDGNGYVDDVRGWNFANRNNNPMDDDVDGHGTHVAGIIGAVGNNGFGVSGVNWAVKVMPLKFLDADGYGDIADAVAAMDYAVANGARLINASYTYPQRCGSMAPSEAERQAIARAGAANVLILAAAGNFRCNNDQYPFYPAGHALANIISVAATDQSDALANFSNYGATSVHLAAPGVNIYSTVRQLLGSYGYISGTSMATPMVAGVAALLSSYRTDLSMLQVRELISQTVDRKDSLAGRVMSGGRVNAWAALQGDLATTAPMPPGLLVAVRRSDTQVDLTWVDNSTIETSYVVERSTTRTGDWRLIATLPAGQGSYSDMGVAAGSGTVIRYRVRAENNMGASAWSNVRELVNVPLSPSGLEATAAGEEYVRLRWRYDGGVEVGFEIQRRAEGQSFSTLAMVGPAVLQYEDRSAASGQLWYYRVRALSGGGVDSGFSNVASVSLPALVSAQGEASPCLMAALFTGVPGGAAHLARLRRLRDHWLRGNAPGRIFVRWYYRFSPFWIARFARSNKARAHLRRILLPLLWLVILLPGGCAASTPTDEKTALLVQFKPGSKPDSMRSLLQRFHPTAIEPVGNVTGLYRVTFPSGRSLEAVQGALANVPEIEFVEPNIRVNKPSSGN